MRLCISCMELVDDQFDVCPYCGYIKGTKADTQCLEIGTVLQGRYLLGKILQYGGMSNTYIGYDTGQQRKVKIEEYFPKSCMERRMDEKELRACSKEAYEQFIKGMLKFLKEAEILESCGSIPGVEDIYDYFCENGTGYAVLEYMEGQTAEEILAKQGKLSYYAAEKIILKVLEGLSAVHKKGIIHEDISPDNVFLTEDRRVKLQGFCVGCSKKMDYSWDDDEIFICSPYYAEEQYHYGKVGPWTDVYGTGATFYRMITGGRPLAPPERMEPDDLKKPSEFGVKIPPEKEEVLMKSLGIQKEDRLQSAEEFWKALTDGKLDESWKDRKREKDQGDGKIVSAKIRRVFNRSRNREMRGESGK